MDAADLTLPASSSGYRVEDLERFLDAADRRVAELEAAIAAAEARRDAAIATIEARSQVRGTIADTWLAAQREADAIRAAAHREINRATPPA